VVLPWRSGTAWRMSLFMGGQSLMYYTAMTWLPPLYVSEGWSARDAGLALAAFSLAQLVTSLSVPALSDRHGDRRPWIALCGTSASLTLLVLGVDPGAAGWVCAATLGVGIGGQFSLALSVLVDVAPTSADAARLSGMAFLVGYLLAATGPVLAGVLHDVSGGYRVPSLALVVVGVLTVLVGVSIRPGSRI